jgi:nucleotide-binding universal stress UspA family protein
MVRLDLDQPNTGLLRVASELAERCGAGVIGIVACQPFQSADGDSCVGLDVVQQELAEIRRRIDAAEHEFRAAMQPFTGRIEWRSAIIRAPLHEHLAREARSADLLLTKVDGRPSQFDTSQQVDIGGLVLQAGRPILVVPGTAAALPLDRVVIGWRETSAARRAASDALPVLKRAKRVTLVEIAVASELPDAERHLADVAGWLRDHGVAAEQQAIRAEGSTAEQFGAIIRTLGADLVVAGAYGHSRLRERVLGGVTQDLLFAAETSALVSH